MSDFNLHDEIEETVETIEAAVGELCQPMSYVQREEAKALKRAEMTSPGLDDLKNSLKSTVREEVVCLRDDTVIFPQHGNSQARREIEAVENLQIKRRKQYEADRLFFEQNVLKKSRGLGEIQEDYVKILHPHYREKFMAGIEKYGTVVAALKYMRDVYGLKVRSDLLKRMTMMIPALKTEIDDAIAMYQATIQIALHKRAVEGVDKNIYDREGNVIATDKVYSDSLLAKLADTYNPEYKEAKAKSENKGNTINVQIIKDFHNYKDK